MALADLSILWGVSGDVSASKAESPGVSPLSTFWGLIKAGSDWCLFLLSSEESS